MEEEPMVCSSCFTSRCDEGASSRLGSLVIGLSNLNSSFILHHSSLVFSSPTDRSVPSGIDPTPNLRREDRRAHRGLELLDGFLPGPESQRGVPPRSQVDPFAKVATRRRPKPLRSAGPNLAESWS